MFFSAPVHAAQYIPSSCDQYSADILHRKAMPYAEVIRTAASRYGVSAALIKAVITAETCFRPGSVSNKGAGGLMQLMPATAERFGVDDRFNPAKNIDGGVRYLRFLLNRYRGSIPHAVAAYNSGEGRVDEYGAAVPFEETRRYVVQVMNAYKKLGASGNSREAQLRRQRLQQRLAQQRLNLARQRQAAAAARRPVQIDALAKPTPVKLGELRAGSYVQVYQGGANAKTAQPKLLQVKQEEKKSNTKYSQPPFEFF